MGDSPGTSDLDALIRQFMGSDLRELHVRAGAFELYVSKDADASAPWTGGVAPAVQAKTPGAASTSPTPSADTEPASQVTAPEGCEVLRAPYLGHFYRAPKPGEPNLVELGQTVEAGTDLCLVEVMKLFTAVRAETRCVVREIYAADGQMVQEGQPLFAVEPVG